MKDPVLLSYTAEELMYEYLDHTERAEYAKSISTDSEEAAEEGKFDEAMKWAEEEEAKDKALQEQQLTKQSIDKSSDLTPEDVKWMEEQLANEKKELGEDFGEDFIGEF